MKISSLSQVVDYQLCCGCGLCAYLDPENVVMADAPAFGRRPRFSDEAEKSSLLQAASQPVPWSKNVS